MSKVKPNKSSFSRVTNRKPKFGFDGSGVKVVRWRTEHNATCALVIEPTPASKTLLVCVMDSDGIKVSEIPRSEMVFMELMEYDPYDMIEKLLTASKSFGIDDKSLSILMGLTR